MSQDIVPKVSHRKCFLSPNFYSLSIGKRLARYFLLISSKVNTEK